MCGWCDIPCLSISKARSNYNTLTTIKLLYSSSALEAENEGIAFTLISECLIEGEVEESDSDRVMKNVVDIGNILFTAIHCVTVNFSSIAFHIQSSSLSHSLFFITHSSLILTSISIPPSSTSTTSTQLKESLIVSSYGSTLNISSSVFKDVALTEGNGSVISARIGDGSSFVILNSSLSGCSSVYGGALYLVIGSDPAIIGMNDVTFIGNENSASKSGNTLFVVWKCTSNMNSEQFRSFVTLSEETNNEAKVETWKRGIMTLAHFVSGEGTSEEGEGSSCGSEGEGKNGYKVCTQIEMSANIGRVVVVVVDEKEEIREDKCTVGMEEGEVSGEVEMGEVNREGITVNLRNEFKKILEECEDIEIAMNISLFNG